VLVAIRLGMLRQAVGRALSAADGVEVVAEHADGGAAIAAAERLQPDVAIVDADLGDGDGVHATCVLNERVPSCRILLLAEADDPRLLRGSIACGASAFLTKDASLDEVVAGVRAVAGGDTLVPPHMLGDLLRGLVHRQRNGLDARIRLASLTPRERTVAALLARGTSTHDIAHTLVVSVETARTHVQHVLGKFGVHSRTEAAALLLENGLVEELE
jgi:DNA-binding NarL/FixJ family response regulator